MDRMMLLREVTIKELAEILGRHRGDSPAGYLRDEKAVRRAKRWAKGNGVWKELDEKFDPTRGIEVVKRSVYRRYARVGDRNMHQGKDGSRLRELERAATALWLGHPKADVDYLQDLMWAICEQTTWVMSAHEGLAIDLGSAMLGARLAELLYVLGDKLEEEVTVRVRGEIEKRIFDAFADWRVVDSWRTARHNWNHVCNGEVVRMVLYMIEDEKVAAQMIHGAVNNMTYALDGFTDDGGCVEGPSYWTYGFGHFLMTAWALHQKTGGEVNIMGGEKVERISRFPLAAQIEGRFKATFADARPGYVPMMNAYIVNQFYDIPELFELCEHDGEGRLKVGGMHGLALYDGRKVTGREDDRDYELPEMGMVKMRGKAGRGRMTVAAIAGNNGVSHNHNDIGSFMVYKHGRMALVDPGSPVYKRKTFSPERYEIVFCSSVGHSVPRINGREQKAGAEYYGVLETENLNGEGAKTARVDMSHAYPKGTVKKLMRTLRLDAVGNALEVEDAYEFKKEPGELEEAFVTFEKSVEVGGDGRSVRIGRGRSGVELRVVEGEGRFRVVDLVEESKEGKGGEVLRRIVFDVSGLGREMRLRFEVK